MTAEFAQKSVDAKAVFETFSQLSAPFQRQIESLINAGALYERAENMLAQNNEKEGAA